MGLVLMIEGGRVDLSVKENRNVDMRQIETKIIAWCKLERLCIYISCMFLGDWAQRLLFYISLQLAILLLCSDVYALWRFCCYMICHTFTMLHPGCLYKLPRYFLYSVYVRYMDFRALK